jgi:hypothetical protein
MSTIHRIGRGAAYRSPLEVARARCDDLLARRAQELDDLPPAIVSVYRWRAARAAAGATAIAGFVGMGAVTLVEALGQDFESGLATSALRVGVVASLVACAVGALAGPASLRAKLVRGVALTGDPCVDRDRIEEATPARLARAKADRIERASAGLPLVGVALLGPLTLHFAVSRLIPMPFDWWIALSLGLVGHAHLVLAYLAWKYAGRLQQARTEELAWGDESAWSALGITVAATVLPSLWFFFVPSLLVGLTGLVLVPLAFSRMRVAILRERRVLEASSG